MKKSSQTQHIDDAFTGRVYFSDTFGTGTMMNKQLFLYTALVAAAFVMLCPSDLAAAENNWLHPADRDGDWQISPEEAQRYLQDWQTQYNPMVFAIQALKLSQGGGWYHYQDSQSISQSWAAGSGSQQPVPEEGMIVLGTAAAPADTEIRIPVIYEAGEKAASTLLFTVLYDPDEMIFQEMAVSEKVSSAGKEMDGHKRAAGVLTLVVYGGQDTIESTLLAELHFLIRAQVSETVSSISIRDHSGATPEAGLLSPGIREGAVFITAPKPVRD